MPRVLVTGASRGIGRATALRLARHGWDVIAAVRRAGDAEPLLTEQPGRITATTLDITDESQVAVLDRTLPSELDAVVNNAGIFVGGPFALALSELRRQLEVTVVGQLAVTQAVVPRLRASRGRLVFVSSLSATPMFDDPAVSAHRCPSRPGGGGDREGAHGPSPARPLRRRRQRPGPVPRGPAGAHARAG